MTSTRTTTTWSLEVVKTTNNPSLLKTSQLKREAIGQFIQDNKVILAICGGFQLLGQYYIQANGVRIDGIGVMGHYTPQSKKIIVILVTSRSITKRFDETYYGFENHQGAPSSLMMKTTWKSGLR